MPEISLGSFKYYNSHQAYFQLAERIISAPSDFITFLSNTVFEKSIKNNKCDVIERRQFERI